MDGNRPVTTYIYQKLISKTKDNLFENKGVPSSKAKYNMLSNSEKYREGKAIELVTL